MGTSLQNTKIKDTYEGLIKTTDNNTVGSSNKQLTDGAGNDLNISINNTGVITAESLVKNNGTALQILLADGTTATAGDGITIASDEIEVTVDDSTIELSTSDGNGAVRVKDGGITNAKIANDAIDHDELAARYTAKSDISTTSGTINLDTSSFAIFELTGNVATVTLNIQNMKKGTVIDILLSGSDLSNAVITLSDDFTTSQINKVGGTDLNTSLTNLLQVVCIDDDDNNAILNYSINTYISDTTP